MENFDSSSLVNNPDEKEVKLDKARDRVERIVDKLGKGIDEGIKESVVAFMMHEFPTSGSCEGHLTDNKNNRPFLYSHVDIQEPEPEGWRDNKELQEQWSEANALQKIRMQKLLDEFYADKNVDDEYRLVINSMGIFNAFVLASARYAYKRESLRPDEVEVEILARIRQEMDDFTKFLMKKYQETE